jgi:hypothetical protein
MKSKVSTYSISSHHVKNTYRGNKDTAGLGMSAGIHAPAASTPATARIVGVFMEGIKAQLNRG